jgi:hypothetical protein
LKAVQILFQRISQAWWLVPIIIAIWDMYIGGSWSESSTAKNMSHSLKNS